MSGKIGRCLVTALLLLGWQAGAQSPVENLRKYNSFRERLNRDFLYRSGDATLQGSYLPMESRQTAADGTVTAYWADGTWWLAHYVAVLATEQARLEMEGDSAAALQSLAELRQALRVYDRLDCMAEPCWGGDSCTNGFYLRDDLPASMAELFGAGRILSDYAQHCGDRQSLANGPSQDQAWASYLGLALVQALTDDTLLHAHAAQIIVTGVARALCLLHLNVRGVIKDRIEGHQALFNHRIRLPRNIVSAATVTHSVPACKRESLLLGCLAG